MGTISNDVDKNLEQLAGACQNRQAIKTEHTNCSTSPLFMTNQALAESTQFGLPEQLVSDNGPQFTVNEFK